jgi:diguanylate cyclase
LPAPAWHFSRVEQAEEIVERLRKATPGETTCSAGLALWDGVESADELLTRADSALYMAKAGGRNALMLAPSLAA